MSCYRTGLDRSPLLCKMPCLTYCAGVFAKFATGADEAGSTQLEERSKAGPSETLFAVIRIEYWNVDLFEDVLEVSCEWCMQHMLLIICIIQDRK